MDIAGLLSRHLRRGNVTGRRKETDADTRGDPVYQYRDDEVTIVHRKGTTQVILHAG